MSIFGGKTDNLSEILKWCLSTDGSLDNGGFAHGSCSKVLKNVFYYFIAPPAPPYLLYYNSINMTFFLNLPPCSKVGVYWNPVHVPVWILSRGWIALFKVMGTVTGQR